MKDNKAAKLYISDHTEAEKESPKYGDSQVLEAEGNDTDTGREGDYENTGNKSAKYYKR